MSRISICSILLLTFTTCSLAANLDTTATQAIYSQGWADAISHVRTVLAGNTDILTRLDEKNLDCPHRPAAQHRLGAAEQSDAEQDNEQDNADEDHAGAEQARPIFKSADSGRVNSGGQHKEKAAVRLGAGAGKARQGAQVKPAPGIGCLAKDGEIADCSKDPAVVKQAIKLIGKSPHPNAAVRLIQRSKGRKQRSRKRSRGRSTKLAKRVKDLERKLKTKTIELAKMQVAAKQISQIPSTKTAITSQKRTKSGRAKQCSESSRFAPKWMTDAELGCSSDLRRGSKSCNKQSKSLARVLKRQGKCGRAAKCKTNKSLAKKPRRWNRFQDFASSVLGKCVKRSDTRMTVDDDFIIFPGECLSAKGECKCTDGKYMAALGGPGTQQKFFALADRLSKMITVVQQFLCHDIKLGEGIDEANEIGEDAGLWRRRRRRAPVRTRRRRWGSGIVSSIKRGASKAGKWVAKKAKGAGGWLARKAWNKIKSKVPKWARSTLRKMLFERKFSGALLWKGMQSKAFFDDYKGKNWKRYLTKALGLNLERNKYACMLINSLGNGNGLSTRVSAKLVRIGTSPPKPAKPNPKYDLPNEATSFEMWLTQGDSAFWRKAQSSTFSTMQDPHSPSCMPPPTLKAGNPKDHSMPGKDGTIWGCPTAIPKGSSGNWRWETSTEGKYATKTVQQIPPPKCSMRLKFVMSACDTCCCKDGIIKSEMSSSLQHGTHGDCGAWFASNDGLYRMIFSSGRPSAIAEWYTRSCYNSKAISATRKELRELKKSTNKH